MATGSLLGVSSASHTSSSLTPSQLAISGLASGMNWTTIVTELAQAERAPETQWQAEQTTIAAEQTAYATISTDLLTLQNDALTLTDPSYFNSVVATSSNSAVATASTASGTPTGSYTFDISQLATAAQVNGATGISQPLVPDGVPANVTMGTAGFATTVTGGTFTVNGAQIKLAATDSLQQVFDNIKSATNNAVTASYDPTKDEIKLTSSSPIVLGNTTDTSNFLQVAQLYNNNGGATNNTGTITSTGALGHVNLASNMSAAGLQTPITDGGSGKGAFTINGVTFNFNASTDSLRDIINNINESAAGVSAAYDPINNRFMLTNNNTGDVGISMQDAAGSNFLAATGLTTGTLSHGKNLLYTLNGGSQPIVSQSNTISSASSGITGLSVSALATGATTVNVSPDTTTIGNTIQQFVNDYNTLQSFITSQEAVTTSPSGTVTPGTLTGDGTANDIVSSLRSVMGSVKNIAGTSGAVTSLSDLGFESSGANNQISLSNSGKLTSALTSNLKDVAALFSNSTSGLAIQLNKYITKVNGTNGELPTRTADLSSQNTTITKQISTLETKISADSDQWTSEFQAMETAESKTNQELTYLTQSVTSGAL